MTTITIDLEDFTKALQDTTNKSLGWVWLQPEALLNDEITPPSFTPPVPTVMADFALIASPKYKFNYTSRYYRYAYLLERDGQYEAGELTAIHDMPVGSLTINDEPSPPIEPEPFTPPNITTVQNATLGSIGSLGVEFSFIHDSGTNGNDAKFGLGFKITNDTPAIFPRLILSYTTVFIMEDV